METTEENEANQSPLENLPLELLTKILSSLETKDLMSASLTCKALNKAAQVEEVWESLARRSYGIRLKPRKNFENHSPKMFYQKVLHRFGRCLGLWQRQDFSHYGNLTQVSKILLPGRWVNLPLFGNHLLA